MPSFLFSLGNSTDGAVGYCARIEADYAEEAVATLQEKLKQIEMGVTISDGDDNYDQGRVEYLEVYFNFKAVSLDDIEEINGDYGSELDLEATLAPRPHVE